MTKSEKTVVKEDPTPKSFAKQFLYSALVLLVVGIAVIIFASAVTGGILVLLAIITGGASMAAKN